MKKSILVILTSCLSIQFILLSAQNFKQSNNSPNQNLINQISTKLNEYNTLNFYEKIYIHFNKPFYVLGEDIWFSIYLVNAENHTSIVPSNIVYVELIGPGNKILVTKTIKVIGGKAAGDFEIDKSLIPGTYIVRAYTNYMRNFDPDFFFKKRISIKSINTEMISSNDIEKRTNSKPGSYASEITEGFDFQLFPEGGDLIKGLASVVGFKAVNDLGKGVEIEGGLFDQDGNMLTFIKSNKFGMGAFNITPESGNNYYVKLKVLGQEHNYSLPRALTNGYVMRVDNLDDNHIKILLESNIPQGIKNATLIGHIRGKIVFTKDQFPDQMKIQMRISKSELEDGILHLTLFDEKGLPQCERLVFILKTENKINTKLNVDKEYFEQRNKVQLMLNLNDAKKNGVKGKFSVSITKNDLVSHDENEENILSYLLLSSDLKGNIENPGYYFKEISKLKTMELDQLMLSQGWRRFKWNDVLNNSENHIKFYPEKGVNVSGRIIDLYNEKKVVKGKVSLVAMKGLVELQEVKTSDDGRFLFMGYDLPSATDIILKATSFKMKKKKNVERESVKIILDQFKNAHLDNELAEELENIHFARNKERPDQNYINHFEKISTYNRIYNFNKDAIILDELTVKSTSQKEKDPYYSKGRLYSTPSYRKDLTKYPVGATATNGLDALLHASIPGVSVGGKFPNYSVKFRGKRVSAFLLDNMLVDAFVIGSISASSIHYVDVVQNAPIYGLRGSGGLIAIYTKQGPRFVPDPKGVLSFKSPTYNIAREFYNPKYDVLKPEHSKPDHRITLYWNPDVKTNDEGEAIIEFYTSDDNAKYRIDIQGISEKGQPFITEKLFSVGKK